MYNDESSIPIVRQQAELIVKLNALLTVMKSTWRVLVSPRPDDTIGLRRQPPLRHHPPRTEDINPGFQGTSGRTASRQPQKVPRDDGTQRT